MLCGKHTRPRSQKHLPTIAKGGCHGSPRAMSAVGSQSQDQLPALEGRLCEWCLFTLLFPQKASIYWCLKIHSRRFGWLPHPAPLRTLFLSQQGLWLRLPLHDGECRAPFWRTASLRKNTNKQLPGSGRLCVYCVSRVSSWEATWTLLLSCGLKLFSLSLASWRQVWSCSTLTWSHDWGPLPVLGMGLK